MRRIRLLALLALFGAIGAPLALPTPAHAELNPPCHVQATVMGDDGTPYDPIDPGAKTGVYTVPIAGAAQYDGGIDIEVPDEGRPISGSVSVALPLGGSVNIKSWSDEDSTNISDIGEVTWDLPDATPRGIEMTVSGHHNDLQSCEGSIVVKLDGGVTDSITGIASLIAAIVTGALAIFAGIPTR